MIKNEIDENDFYCFPTSGTAERTQSGTVPLGPTCRPYLLEAGSWRPKMSYRMSSCLSFELPCGLPLEEELLIREMSEKDKLLLLFTTRKKKEELLRLPPILGLARERENSYERADFFFFCDSWGTPIF